MGKTPVSKTTYFDLTRELAERELPQTMSIEELQRLTNAQMESMDDISHVTSTALAKTHKTELLPKGLLHVAASLAIEPDTSEGRPEILDRGAIITRAEVVRQIDRMRDLAFTGWPENRGRAVKIFPTPLECKIAKFVLKNLSDAHQVPLYELTQVGETQLMVPVEPLKMLANRERIEMTTAAGREGGIAGKIGI